VVMESPGMRLAVQHCAMHFSNGNAEAWIASIACRFPRRLSMALRMVIS